MPSLLPGAGPAESGDCHPKVTSTPLLRRWSRVSVPSVCPSLVTCGSVHSQPPPSCRHDGNQRKTAICLRSSGTRESTLSLTQSREKAYRRGQRRPRASEPLDVVWSLSAPHLLCGHVHAGRVPGLPARGVQGSPGACHSHTHMSTMPSGRSAPGGLLGLVVAPWLVTSGSRAPAVCPGLVSTAHTLPGVVVSPTWQLGTSLLHKLEETEQLAGYT